MFERTRQLAEKSGALEDKLLFIVVLLDAPLPGVLQARRLLPVAIGPTSRPWHHSVPFSTVRLCWISLLPCLPTVSPTTRKTISSARRKRPTRETVIPLRVDGHDHDTLYSGPRLSSRQRRTR